MRVKVYLAFGHSSCCSNVASHWVALLLYEPLTANHSVACKHDEHSRFLIVNWSCFSKPLSDTKMMAEGTKLLFLAHLSFENIQSMAFRSTTTISNHILLYVDILDRVKDVFVVSCWFVND